MGRIKHLDAWLPSNICYSVDLVYYPHMAKGVPYSHSSKFYEKHQNGKFLLTPALEKNVLVSIIRIRLWGSSVGPTLQLP